VRAPAVNTLTWDAVPYPGVTYDLLRGNLHELPVGSGAGEACMQQSTSLTTATDTDLPVAGRGFWYLVRERVPGCGIGTYGMASSGAEQLSAECP